MARMNGNSPSCGRISERFFWQPLADPDTVEICLNADGSLWQERLGEPLQTDRNDERKLRRRRDADDRRLSSCDPHTRRPLDRMRTPSRRIPLRGPNPANRDGPGFCRA